MTDIALRPQQSSIWWVFLLQGLAGVILGLMLLTEPGATMVALTTLLGFYWLIIGVLALVQVFVDRSTPWIWSLLSGIVGILAGLFVLRHPLIAALTVPTVIVIILGVQGLVMGVIGIIGGFQGGGVGSFILGVVNVLVGLLLLGSPVAGAAQRGYKAVVPVDGMSSETAFEELYVAWRIAKGGPANLVDNATLTRSELVKFAN
jgi:uncharacterized membrane protein HdeD (DUF308 family)